MSPLQFTRSVRSLNRLRHIAKVLTQHGFGHIVAQINLARFVPVWMMRSRARAARRDQRPSTIGRHLKEVCTELGPTFIKLGQLMSTRPDIVPQEVVEELRKLQDDVPPFDTSVAMDTVARQIGRPVEECFAWIGDAPIASGSIGQVYRARAHDGTELVVKVRRPQIEETIKLDMQLLRWLAESLEKLMPELRSYRPAMLVSELEEMLTRELDYINEASATVRFAEGFEDDAGIRVPKVYWEFSGPSVLTLEALKGANVDKALNDGRSNDQPIDRRLVARRLVDCYIRQVFDLGLFHADPHPGNILIEPPGRVGLIDFGQVGRINDELMTQLVVIIYACVSNEISVVIDTFADMGAVARETDRRALHRSLQVLLDKYYGLPIKRFDLAQLFTEFTDVVRRHDVVIPRDLMMLLKAIGTMSGTVVRLDPDLDMVELLQPRLKQALSDRLSPKRLAHGSALMGWHLVNIIRQAPGQLRDLLRRLSTGSWQLDVRHHNIDRLISELDRSSNRLAFSIVIAAIIVGSSVIISADSELTLFSIKIQHFGMVGYLFAGVLGLALAWAIFRSGRLH